ncbi:hypothetical protein M3212_14060 [Alkalihalobacillus oceani]|uniref:UPF0738 family protein n=1 Tax=Halalkalibacter oceani TaxID=1653776 RepID=UPI002041916B|nr:hypothetical protein [Halalkalibacter oceani]MCM3761896.1 hypothetical protein [Halalkalibacter oceani]
MKKLVVTNIDKQQQEYVASIAEHIEKERAQALKAGERMLVDSDQLAFIYILEDEEQFYYLSFPQPTWSNLHEIYTQGAGLSVNLENGVTVKLSGLAEELAFLTENIKGNSNYGEELENAVEEVFGQDS